MWSNLKMKSIYLSFFSPKPIAGNFSRFPPQRLTDSSHNRCSLGDDGSNPRILLGVVTFSSFPHLLHLSGSTSARSCVCNPFSRGSQMLKSAVAPPDQDLVFACGIWNTWFFAVCLTRVYGVSWSQLSWLNSAVTIQSQQQQQQYRVIV